MNKLNISSAEELMDGNLDVMINPMRKIIDIADLIMKSSKESLQKDILENILPYLEERFYELSHHDQGQIIKLGNFRYEINQKK